jgi:hypothetical protein
MQQKAVAVEEKKPPISPLVLSFMIFVVIGGVVFEILSKLL